MQQLSLQQMEKCGSHVVSGGSQQQPSHSLPPIKETDDDNTASEDMEDEGYYAPRSVARGGRDRRDRGAVSQKREEEEEEMKHLPSGGVDACSVMAQCGSDSCDISDPEDPQSLD